MTVTTSRLIFALAGTVGLAALSAAGEAKAQTDGTLPPVTIDPPRARTPAPVARAPRTAGSGAAPRSVVRSDPRRAAPRPVASQPVQSASAAGSFATPSTGIIGATPAPYFGGQVASGATLGFLGNRGIMETPFNQTSFTAKLIQDQQARTIRTVLENDPSVRVVSTPGTGTDALFIRGFYYDSGDLALNGLYGIPPLYSTDANFVERVEVLKGPNSLLNGMPPAGAVGGSVNLVSKKAPDYDVTQLTGTFISRGTFGLQTDIARRYGESKEWGIRFNGGYRSGATPFDRQKEEFANAVVGIDYRGENIRVSADVGHQGSDLKPPIRFITPVEVSALGRVPFIPQPPRAGSNFMVPWAKWTPTDTFAMARAEIDVTDWMTVYGAFGYHKSDNNFIYPSPNLIRTDGTYFSNPFRGEDRFETLTGEAGIRTKFETGFIKHSLNFNFSAIDRPNWQDFRLGTPIFANIYALASNPAQYPNRLAVLNRNTTTLTSLGVADTMSILDDRLQLTVGVRHQTTDTRSLNYLTGARTSADGAVWSPAAALLLRPTDYLSLYANYIEGLEAGQVVGGTFSNSGALIGPGQTKQKEVGAKLDLGRFGATLSFFDITRPSIVSVAGVPLPSLARAGEQRNRGAEINVFGEILPGLRALGGVALIDGELTRAENPLYKGNRAVGVAQTNVNLGAELDVPYIDGLTLTGRVVYTSEQKVNVSNTLSIPEWTRFDIGARYTFLSPFNGKPIVIRAGIENVGNKSYWASAYNGVITAAPPRTYLVSTTFNF